MTAEKSHDVWRVARPACPPGSNGAGQMALAHKCHLFQQAPVYHKRPDARQSLVQSNGTASPSERRGDPNSTGTYMSDEIRINGLFLRTIIGINEDEREHKQDVRINLALAVDTRLAARSDKIDDAVNYRTITKDVIDLVENSRFFLVERMAEEIARLCLNDPRVERVKVSIEKPAALRFARSVGVSIQRSRADV
jgi:D-erythro-7,8-dihydroneopterin triphosphate epimerase